jgi:transcription initiation factor TFIIIB Brf1 subunit/transcription initiation factor TFIIB
MNKKTVVCPFCKRKSEIIYEGAIAFITIKCLTCGSSIKDSRYDIKINPDSFNDVEG